MKALPTKRIAYGHIAGHYNEAEDLIIVFYYDGYYELTTFEMSNRYESKKGY